jgi:hypothetical protein
LVLLFRVGYKLYDARFGLLWAGAYFGSVLPHLYFRSGIIDPWFNLFMFVALLGVVLFQWKKDDFVGLTLFKSKWFYLLGGGAALGLAVITKGPAAFLIVGLTLFVYWVLQLFRFYINGWHFLFYLLAAVFFPVLWFGLETAKNGPWFVQTFLTYNYRLFSTPDAGHGGFPGYHFVVLLVGCFPASVFAIRGMAFTAQPFNYQREFKRWMLILFWVVLVLFTIVKSKIVHYSSMCYFPLTYLAALTVYQMWEGKIRFNAWLRFGLLAIGLIYCTAFIAAPFVGQRIDLIRPLVEKDPFALANLDADVNWTGWEALAGGLLLVALTLGVRWLNRRRPDDTLRGAAALFGGTGIFVFFTLIFFIARIEGISQAAAMQFYESLQGKDVYVTTYGFRSYGHYFYTRLPNHANPKRHDQNWLLRGPVDKDVYVAAKITSEAELDTVRTLKKIGEKNGFLFYKRVRGNQK